MDRAAAMQKISDTFGYGEGKKATFQKNTAASSGPGSGGPGPAERKQLAADTAVAHKNKVGFKGFNLKFRFDFGLKRVYLFCTFSQKLL